MLRFVKYEFVLDFGSICSFYCHLSSKIKGRKERLEGKLDSTKIMLSLSSNCLELDFVSRVVSFYLDLDFSS